MKLFNPDHDAGDVTGMSDGQAVDTAKTRGHRGPIYCAGPPRPGDHPRPVPDDQRRPPWASRHWFTTELEARCLASLHEGWWAWRYDPDANGVWEALT